MLSNRSKKYFLISEVEQISGISPSKLRYIEKNDPAIEITKIRDRRYYTAEDLDYILSNYGSGHAITQSQNVPSSDNHQIIARIDEILGRFKELI